jgi:hypothetical protein
MMEQKGEDKAEALASALLQEEAEKKNPFSKSPLAYVIAVAAGAIVAPTGALRHLSSHPARDSIESESSQSAHNRPEKSGQYNR